jgi:uncharacterized repeat protein (TIGR03803 family)
LSRGRTAKSIHVRTAASVVIALVMALLAAAAQAQTYSVLYKFHGKPDGAYPSALIQDAMGNLYGTAGGGAYNAGTVFKFSKTGETILYSFCPSGHPCADGVNPRSGLVQDAMGSLNGTTYYGGNGTGCGYTGCGVVFKLDTTGKETVLYSFCPGGNPCIDGENPDGGLIQDANGNLYGTAFMGGGSGCRNGYGCGAVFKVDANGKETVSYSFHGFPDGQYPNSGVIQDASGNLYGSTFGGGAYNKGMVFRLNKTGMETVLRSFKARNDGKSPSRLIQDAKGDLYGTTLDGGNVKRGGCGCGVVFRLDVTGKETVLHRFAGGVDGATPFAGVIRDAKGNLYGTTYSGGDRGCGQGHGCGVVFKLSSTGEETILYRFRGGKDGANPIATVIRDAQGNLYGTTTYGGDLSCGAGQGCGVVFKLTP